MRFKPVPEPPADLDELRAVQRAVPLVPGSEDDCCERLRRRRDLADRATANDWLAFLRAVGLAEETPSGFRRTDAEPTAAHLRERLPEGVYGAADLLELLRERSEPVDADAAFAALRESVPRHDRSRNPAWEADWRDRTERLLEWFVLAGLAERVDGDRYVAAE